MSKPPFILSNRNGTKLWPNTIQQMPVQRVKLSGTGLSAQEIELAKQLVNHTIDQNVGRLKQFFLMCSNAANIGIVDYTQRRMILGPGIGIVYIRNGPREEMVVTADANAVIESASVKTGRQLIGDHLLIGLAGRVPLSDATGNDISIYPHITFRDPALNSTLSQWYGYINDSRIHSWVPGQDGPLFNDFPIRLSYQGEPVLHFDGPDGALRNTGDASGLPVDLPRDIYFGSEAIHIYLRPFRLLGYQRVTIPIYAFRSSFSTPELNLETQMSAYLLSGEADVPLSLPEIWRQRTISFVITSDIPMPPRAEYDILYEGPEGLDARYVLNLSGGLTNMGSVTADMSVGVVTIDPPTGAATKPIGYFGSYNPIV